MFSPVFPSAQISVFELQCRTLFGAHPDQAPKYTKQFQRTQSHKTTPRFTGENSSCLSDYRTSCTLQTDPESPDDYNSTTCFNRSLVVPEFRLVAKWLQSSRNTKEIKKIHACILKCVNDLEVFCYNNLISQYIKHGRLVQARNVFDKMSQRNVVSWTAMLNGYIIFGLFSDAARHFIEFAENGIPWNSKTFVCVLNLCCKRLDFELGKQVHARMLKGCFSGLILDSAVVYFYVQGGELENAFRVFNRMNKRDVVCWTTIITACSQHGRGEEAFQMFSRMLADGFEPNEYTVCSVLDACGEEKGLKLGKQLHGAIVKRQYRMDIFVGTSLVDMYAKCGEMEDSRMVFDGMRKRNTVTWTSLIAGYARNGLGEEAIRHFRVMQRRRIAANNLTMVSILRACGLLGALQMGKEVHAQVFRNHVQGNIFIGSALVWLYCRCVNYSAASKVLQHMPLRDVVSWTSMISGCARLGHEQEALEYLKEMLGEGVDPNCFTYSSALKACAQLEDIRQGKLIHSSINKTPASSNVFVGSALIHMYAKCGHLAEAIRVFDSMPERNLVSWKAMIIAYARNGLCRDAFKLMYRMQAEGIQLDDYIFATVLTACGDVEWDVESVLKQGFDSSRSFV
ncbi:pentatricopeptide repeat-containing protein At4g18520, chloroplastic [Coffea arabica]|uniref:Pentatricopeptide repeat-containing protein At4g18520, chloroplastic n=1 Tax=Coffea arabica TaxID=13443 RepID=A0A6P6UKC5_COFAR|nr:pentatricopeptide repeat-containing protein At4g18520, chloroplastic-like [Coffea arabica]